MTSLLRLRALTFLGIAIGLVLAGAAVGAFFGRVAATPPSGAEVQIRGWVNQLSNAQLTPARHLAQQRLEAAGPASVNPLIGALHSPDAILRRNAAEMLGFVRSPLALDALVSAMSQDPVAAVRARSAWALGELNDLRAVAPLEQALVLDQDLQVRQEASASLDALRYYLPQPAGGDQNRASAFAVAPSDQNLVYLADFNQLWVSHDSGTTWGLTARNLPSRISSLAISPANADTVYAGTESMGLYKSTDGGATWSPVNTGLGLDPGVRLSVTALAIDPLHPERVYAARGVWIGITHANLLPVEVMLSTDGGMTWQSVNLPVPRAVITRLVITRNRLYASSRDQVISVGM
ncbi:MAG: HEAT repeat domain-containing protein [Anaerolineae bacterium]